MPSSRQLAAIMFTDIVGYTALMGEDEERAFELLRKNRELQKPLVAQFNGKWIKEMGDGVLASFPAATDAVSCACSILTGSREVKGLQLRIGIHLGEVVFENGDVYGDGVNIASRLQALAPINRIWISEAVHKNITNKKDISSHFIKTEILKNVKEPFSVYEVGGPVAQTTYGCFTNNKEASKTHPQKSIAVLPFVNMSNDPEQEYFSDGLAEEILNSLANIQSLKVAGRTSSFQYKGKNIDLREIGQKLNVGAVLEGSVRKQSNKLRITAQLINVEDGYHLWSERYDRELDDIFAIQDEITLAITEKLKITLLDDDRGKLAKNYTQNAEAYELYLKGRFCLNRRGTSILTSMQLFQKAMELDPGFALPYVGFADANVLLANYGMASPKTVLPRAKEAAEKALALNPALCEPYCSLAFYFTCLEWNWKAAKQNFLTSIELNPHYADAHYKYAWNYLCWVEGRFDEARKHGEMAIKLDPLSSVCYGIYSLVLHTSGQYTEALAVNKMGLELDPYSFICHMNNGNIYMAMQQYEEAIASFKSAMAISNRHPFAVNGLIWTYCILGKREEAQALMDELRQRSAKEYIASTFTGISAAYLGNIDEALQYLEKAYHDRDPIILTLKYESWVPAILKENPRFKQLLTRIGFPE
jgi:adenylate cyclase